MEDQKHDIQSTVNTDKPTTNTTKMHVRVHAPYKVYYDGPADSISAVNETGPFDVLGRHHNFMTLLDACDLLIRNGEALEKISIARGVMHVKQDEIIVFLDV